MLRNLTKRSSILQERLIHPEGKEGIPFFEMEKIETFDSPRKSGAFSSGRSTA